MSRHLVLVTELTRMNRGNCCVAGWDLTDGRTVRLLQANGGYWQLQSHQALFTPGNLLECQIAAGDVAPYPHRTENLRLKQLPRAIYRLLDQEQYGLLLPHALPSITSVFGIRPTDDRFIPADTHCASLGGVLARRRHLRFYHDAQSRLRLHFKDSDGVNYDLPVTCETLNRAFGSTGSDDLEHWFGVTEANEWLSADAPDQQLILRIGLARAWAGRDGQWNPMRCYLQLNGIITPDNYYTIFDG
jgi:hypothetical protein